MTSEATDFHRKETASSGWSGLISNSLPPTEWSAVPPHKARIQYNKKLEATDFHRKETASSGWSGLISNSLPANEQEREARQRPPQRGKRLPAQESSEDPEFHRK